MSIWTYKECKSSDLVSQFGDRCHIEACAFCGSSLVHLDGDKANESLWCKRAADMRGFCSDYRELQACPKCGWWISSLLSGRAPYRQNDDGYLNLYRACGTLKDLDVTDLSVPVEELRSYLLAKYDDRFYIHPKKFEDIVGSVFSDFGYQIRITSYSGDEGIDVYILDGDDNATVGIQVKRYQGKITAEQIRSFVGALVLKGLTTGIYVTTSAYERGAARTALAAQEKPGVAVSLLDARRFYDALKITQRESYLDSNDSTAPYHESWKTMKEPYPVPNLTVGHCVYMAGW